MFTKDNRRASGVKLRWRRLEESQKRRLGSPGHKFPYFLILSRKLGSLCFYLPVLSSWTFKVMCAIILVFQPKIQESSWFCARVCSDLSLTFLCLFYSLVLYIIYFYICLLWHLAQCLASSTQCQLHVHLGLPRWHGGKESACQCRKHERCRFDPWVGEIAWSRKGLVLVFLPGKCPRQRSLAGYSPRRRRVGHNRAPHHHIMTVTDERKIHVHYLFLFQSEEFGKVSALLPNSQNWNYLWWDLIIRIFKKLLGNSPLQPA